MSASPEMISDFERKIHYKGISCDPPALIWRSDILENPFHFPKGRFAICPTKTAHGVFKTRLNEVWHIVVPLIIAELKKRQIRYSAITSVRFSSMDQDEIETLGPIVLWIATPSTTTTEDARDVTPGISRILRDHQVTDVVVEWYEGTVEKLATAPPLMANVYRFDPTHHVRRIFTASLGIPITAGEMQYDDVEGSLGFFFHENKTKDGEPSERVFGVSNVHVLRKDTTIDYEFRSASASGQYVRLAGLRRYQRCLSEIDHLIIADIYKAERLADIIATREETTWGKTPGLPEDEAKTLSRIQAQVEELSKRTASLRDFYKLVTSQWSDIECRGIGRIDWAPKISIDVNGSRYTMDIATFELDKSGFKEQFKGNVVDLGTKFDTYDLNRKFYADNNSKRVFKFPFDNMFRLRGCVPANILASPDCVDGFDQPCLIVMKDGNTTDLTVGRLTGTEAYVCDESGTESIELAIYNYDQNYRDKNSGPFSSKGDSGSLIFSGDGRMVGLLHSANLKENASHVSYATPAWFILEKIKEQYPHADFWRETF